MHLSLPTFLPLSLWFYYCLGRKYCRNRSLQGRAAVLLWAIRKTKGYLTTALPNLHSKADIFTWTPERMHFPAAHSVRVSSCLPTLLCTNKEKRKIGFPVPHPSEESGKPLWIPAVFVNQPCRSTQQIWWWQSSPENSFSSATRHSKEKQAKSNEQLKELAHISQRCFRVYHLNLWQIGFACCSLCIDAANRGEHGAQCPSLLCWQGLYRALYMGGGWMGAEQERSKLFWQPPRSPPSCTSTGDQSRVCITHPRLCLF